MSCCLTPVRMDTIKPQKITNVGGTEKWGALGCSWGYANWYSDNGKYYGGSFKS